MVEFLDQIGGPDMGYNKQKGVTHPSASQGTLVRQYGRCSFSRSPNCKSLPHGYKPGNFVADASDNLILCDWEQHDAPATTIAPEADGTWDVTEDLPTLQAGRPRLRYIRYSGMPRRNVDEDVLGDALWHTWNVFPNWSNEHPWAIELAEVFSLGRSMWMLLRQPESDFEDITHPDQLIMDWDKYEDIPTAWKQIVDRWMSRDPNERPELVGFWMNKWSSQKAANENH